MDYAHTLAVLGLILNTAGAGVLWKFGLPQPSFDEGVSLGLEDNTQIAPGKLVKEYASEVRKKRARYTALANLGLALLALGFVFQLVGLFV